jgi:hypothetical protein
MRSVPFPSDEDFDVLADKCGGLFIFAVTLMRFIKDPIDLPHRRIKTALAVQTGLDPLYNRIVSAVPQSNQFELVLGTIILLRYPIPITSLAHLIQLEISDVVQSLLGLQSILMIPGRDDEPIQLFHTSLRDFLMDRDRSGALCIPSSHHLRIATKCLTVMLIGPGDGIFYSEKQEYAYSNWVYHCLGSMALEAHNNASNLSSKPSFMNLLTDFLTYQLHYWINTMILNMKLEEISEVVQSMISALQVSLVVVACLQRMYVTNLLLAIAKSLSEPVTCFTKHSKEGQGEILMHVSSSLFQYSIGFVHLQEVCIFVHVKFKCSLILNTGCKCHKIKDQM